MPYEASARVPQVIRGPGFPAGETRDQLVANIDLAPTFLDIANANAGLDVDGLSLLPLAAARRPSATGAGRALKPGRMSQTSRGSTPVSGPKSGYTWSKGKPANPSCTTW